MNVGVIFFVISSVMADVSGVPATLNQVEADPAQRQVEQQYDELQKTMRDLWEPQPESNQHKQEEPYRTSTETNPHKSRTQDRK